MNMKKIFLSLFVLSFFFAKGQDTCTSDARQYVNTNITQNGIRTITGTKLNVALNKILNAVDCNDSLTDRIYVQTDSATVVSYEVLNSQNAPPGSPATGDTYLVGTSPSGAWVGHAKDIAEWNGSAWVFTDGVQGDFLYNATNALTYIFRSGNWVQTTGIPALNNGNTISSGLIIGTNNARSLTFETNNVNRGRFDSVGRFYVYDTSLRKSNKYLQIDSITGRLVASDISQGTLNDSATALNNRINLKASIQNLADTSNVLRALIATKGTGTVTSVATGIGLSGGTITTSGTLVVDTSTIVSKAFLAARGYTTNTGTVTSVATDATMTGGTITSSGTLKVDTTIISTKSNVTGLVQGKQDNLVSGTNIKTVNSTTLLGSGNIVTPDAQTLTAGTNTLTISGGNTVNLNRKVDTSYQIKNTARDSTCQITVINGISYRSCTKDTISTLTATSTTTFTNKRITARVDSTSSSATPSINTDNVDTYKLTAQAADITSFTTNLSGTPTDDQILHIVIIGTGARAITWGSKFESSTVTLPTTTVSTNRLDVYFIWNTATSKWRCGGVW